MHIENFKIFADLVENQSFSRTARLNGVTQSAVSQQLRTLERHFRVLLIDRSQKQFRLTHEGGKLYTSAREILHRYAQIAGELQEMQKVISGTIHISTIYSIGLHELPPVVKQFLVDYPEVNIRVEYRRSNLVVEDVLQNAVDLGLIAYPPKHRQIEAVPFLDDQLVIICNPNHSLAKRKEVTAEELRGHRFIGFDHDIPTRKATDQILRNLHLDSEPVMEFDNVETVKRAVEVDTGIAFVPEATVRQEIRQGTLVKLFLKDQKILRPLAIIYRKGRILSPAMKRLMKMMTERADMFDEPAK